MDFSPVQIGIVALVALLIFGPKRLPELGRSLGGGIREFKAYVTSRHDEIPVAESVTVDPQDRREGTA